MTHTKDNSTRIRIAKNLHVEFSFDDGRMNAGWTPAAPDALPPKLYSKYCKARNDFLQSVAKYLDGPVVVVDADGLHTIYLETH